MSFNRRRNIFTLGDYQTQQHPHQYAKAQISRLRHHSDPFERDPFKIQSYNFHYADKPTYPLQNLVNRVSSQTSVKRFETHFYNYDFAAAGCDKENSAASSTAATTNYNGHSNRFHEFRRRKFLHAQQQQVPPATHHMSSYGNSGQALNNSRQRLGGQNSGSNSSLRQQYQRQQLQQQQQYQQEHQQQQQLRQPSPHRHQQQYHAFCVPCSSNSINANASNIAAIYAYAAPPTTAATATTAHTPLLRTGCNREFLQGIRAVSASNAPDAQHNFQQQCLQQHHQPQQQQQQYQQLQQQQHSRDLQRSKSRGCLPVSQRFYSELGCRSSGTGIGGNSSSSTTALNSSSAAADKNLSGGGGARVSLSQHNNINNVNKRKPLQTLSPKNLVTANVEQRHSSSGCHINININGLNAADHLGGENLTIKIGADKHGVRNHSASSNNLTDRLSSPQQTDNFNIAPSTTTSQTFGIDKRLSKFAISSLREVSSDRGQAEREQKVVAALKSEKATAAAAETAATNDFKTIRAPRASVTESIPVDARSSSSHMRRRSKERMPSLVPWNIDENLRSCFTKENNPDIDLPNNRPTNLMRRIRNSYNSATRDIKNLQKYADEMAEAKRRRTEKKLLNICCTAPAGVPSQRQEQRKLLQPRMLPDLTPPRRCPSHHSLRSNSNEEFSNTMNPLKCGSSELDRRQQSRQSLNKSPWNVNINVYADKCKLLRV